MNKIEDELLAECRSIAETTMWCHEKPTNLDDIITADEREEVAQSYYKAALSYIRVHQPADPSVVLRAVRYLHGHAMPPIRDNTSWFSQSLYTLLLIVYPFASSPKGGEPFFADLRSGMDKADKWAEDGVEP